jgi:DNA-binding PadR family transcriptional regulator
VVFPHHHTTTVIPGGTDMTDRKPSDGSQDFNGLFDMIRGLREDFAARRPRLEITKDAEDRDIRAAVLSVLAATPSTGAGVIRAITERSTDDREPAAAEVYPTLQLLVDEGLATVADDEGRRTFTLTEAGQDEASATGDEDTDADDWAGFFAPFRSFAENTPFAGSFAGARGDLPKAGVKLSQAVHQTAVGGDGQQVEKVTALLDETRRKIYGILAEESTEETPENTGE